MNAPQFVACTITHTNNNKINNDNNDDDNNNNKIKQISKTTANDSRCSDILRY